jgi:N-formylglutamate deformylase
VPETTAILCRSAPHPRRDRDPLMDVFELHRGDRPLLISLPHDGIDLPPGFLARLTPDAQRLPDTDWWIARLYEFARDLGASVLRPRYSRYLIDLNRPPDNLSLYPGQNSTGLCPTIQFDGSPLYLEGQAPTEAEIGQRVERYWRPYHDALRAELARLHAAHGRVLLWEGHSIRSVVPFLFDGRLPDFNLGTANGSSCAPACQQRIEAVLAAQSVYTWVANGRFKGGYITRHYGRPDAGVEAVQLELAQCNYLDEDRFEWDEARAAPTRQVIADLLLAALEPDRAGRA